MRRHVALVLLSALIGGLAVWFYLNFERVIERETVGLQGEAARNPLLALERLVERMGIETRAAADPVELDALGAGDTLILSRARAGYSQQQVQRLRAWVAAGGHLVVEAMPLREDDAVLDAIGVARHGMSADHRKHLAEIALPLAGEPLRVYMPIGVELVDRHLARTRYRAADESGTLVLHFTLDRGRVTVLPSFAFMTTSRIAHHDHAALAWALVRLAPDTAAVLIAPPFERLSLVGWLVREAGAAVLAAALLVLLWLWRAAARFGPIAPDPPAERRRLLDHLRASGRYLWRARAGPRLLASAREVSLHRIARTHPALVDLLPAERNERLAALAQLPLREVELAWSAEAGTAAAFTAAIGTLQQIEEKLTRNRPYDRSAYDRK